MTTSDNHLAPGNDGPGSKLIFLKSALLLSPIPFGCVGRVWQPLFFLLILMLSFYLLNQQKKVGYLAGSRYYFVLEKEGQWLLAGIYVVFLWQIVPWPAFLLKMMSPNTLACVAQLQGRRPSFHSISLVPAETALFITAFSAMAIYFLVLAKSRLDKKVIISVINIMILGAVIQTAFGLAKYLTGNNFFFLFAYKLQREANDHFLTGTLGNPNHFAFYLELAFPLVLAMLILKLRILEGRPDWLARLGSGLKEGPWMIFYLLAAPLLAGGIVLTGSRTGLITLGLSVIIFCQLVIFVRQTPKVQKKLKYILLAFTLLVMFVSVKNTWSHFKEAHLDQSGRFLRWPNTIRMFTNYPLLGSGFGTYRYSYFLYDTDEGGNWSTHAHNDYLESLAEGGIVGGVLLLSLFGLPIIALLGMWRFRRHPGVKVLGIGILTSLFAGSFHSFFDFSLRIPANMFVFVTVLALGMNVVTYKRDFLVDQ